MEQQRTSTGSSGNMGKRQEQAIHRRENETARRHMNMRSLTMNQRHEIEAIARYISPAFVFTQIFKNDRSPL